MSSMSCQGVPAPQEVSIFSASCYGVMCLVTILGNALVVFVVYKDPLKKLKTPFMYFVVNLATADLIVGFVYFPVGVYVLTAEALGKLNEPAAKLLHMSFFISVTASILSLIALTVDRYIAITFPLKYKKYLTWNRCLIITCGIWLISLTVPIGYLKVGVVDFLMVDVFVSITLALIISIISYVRIYKFLQKQTLILKNHIKTSHSEAEEFQLTRLKQEKKITRAFLIMLFLFLCTYGPAVVMILILKLCPHCDCYFRHWLRDLIVVFISINSSMNPFIYTVRLKTFRKSFTHLVKKYRRIRREKKERSISKASLSNTTTHSASTFVSYMPDNKNEMEMVEKADRSKV